MLNSAFGHRPLQQALTVKARDILLMVLVGMLAGNLLLAVSGGFPLTASASTAPAARDFQPANVLSVSYRLNPNNPAQVGEVRLQAATMQGNAPSSLSIRVESAAVNWIACSLAAGTWVCPISGVGVADLANLEVRAN